MKRETLLGLDEEIEEALTSREEFFRTAGEYRRDGRYVVERRGADTSGNSTVFESFEAIKRLYDRLPERFGAEAVTRSGITGSRRHMVLRHFVEHPAFPCRLQSRNPLEVEKTIDDSIRRATTNPESPKRQPSSSTK